jgi:DNA-binding CsgD family transcriptional regulator
MLAAASAFHGLDPEREQRALLQAFEYSLVTELLMTGTSLDELGRRMAAGADVLDGPRSVLLRALSAHVLAPYAEAVPLMRSALDMLNALDDGELFDLGFVGIALATALFDSTAAAAYLARLARIAAEAGALRALDTLLWVRSCFEIGRGDPAEAGRALEQVRELRRAIGYPAENVVNVAHLAWTGAAREDVEGLADVTRILGFGGVETAAKAALAALDIASGRYAEAHRRLSQMVAEPFVQVTYLELANYVEAAVRSGHSADAATMAARIADMADASSTAWLSGLAHRCRALVAGDGDAELHYRLALESFGAAGVPADLGRAHLLYGEWLRRMKRRRDARTQLRAAVDVFDRIEAPAFAARARAELTATGEAMSHREVIAGVELSPREAAVARLAADGQTNAEIGTTLFISANTVDYHLRKVFAKLGVSSRRQLGERFASGD